MTDMFERARALRVVDVFKPGNETGWVTPRILYDPTLGKVPRLERAQFWMDHGTVGTNTLRYWGEGKSANADAEWTCAHYLVPRDLTQYRDGAMHDTRDVVFKMIPDGWAANHAGNCITPIGNHNSLGCEYESLQNGRHDITDRQYEKGALIYTYAAALYSIRDYFRVPHGLVAEPWGRRTDPWAGQFDIARSWELVQQIRHDARVWALWGLPQPQRGI